MSFRHHKCIAHTPFSKRAGRRKSGIPFRAAPTSRSSKKAVYVRTFPRTSALLETRYDFAKVVYYFSQLKWRTSQVRSVPRNISPFAPVGRRCVVYLNSSHASEYRDAAAYDLVLLTEFKKKVMPSQLLIARELTRHDLANRRQRRTPQTALRASERVCMRRRVLRPARTHPSECMVEP
ncbi:hypothetical protein EVAR_43639_1 [Eumeta japonica]|uniref:Uncharacterized protein n=1 Tax=Eumeta variegata TaxID=151549 RepID=A0A4C1ZLX5_EUMVA|nr:hypothetical protein EVAR_43639_1 [Eumeta japonica]